MTSPTNGEFGAPPPAASPRSAPRPLSLQVIRNVTFSIVRKLISGPLFLLLVPFILHRVGSVGYGVWSVLGTVIGLGWLLDLGLSSTITKYVAEYRAQDDTGALRKLLDSGWAIYLLAMLVSTAVLWLFSTEIIGQLFRGPQAPSVREVLPLWWLVLLIVAFDLLGKPFIAVINGCQRLDLVNVLLFCGATTNATLIVTLLCFGGKVRALLWAALLGGLVTLVLGAWIAYRLLPIVPNPLRFDLATAGKICLFSLGLYSGPIMWTIQGQIEKLYLARLVGVVPVGWYGMASDAASKVRRMPDLLLAPVMAAASELDAADQRRKAWQLYFRAQKYTAATILPLVVFALVDSKPLVTLWLGPKLSFIALPFGILIIGNLFAQIGSPIYSVLTGRGILRPSIYTALLTSVLNVALSFLFIEKWGFAGAAWGSALPILIANAYYFSVTQKYFNTPFLTLLRRAYLKPTLCSLAAAAFASGANVMLPGLWTKVLVGTALFGVVYLLGLMLARFFDEFDVSKLEAHLPFARHARRLIPVCPGVED